MIDEYAISSDSGGDIEVVVGEMTVSVVDVKWVPGRTGRASKL